MALIDFPPVDLKDGVRIHPNSHIKVVFKTNRQLPPDQTSDHAEENYRTAFKTSQIELVPAKSWEVNHFLQLEYPSRCMPGPLIRDQPKSPEEIAKSLEYDLDEEDQMWLDEENKRREEKRRKKITPEAFELAIDRLEKETYFKKSTTATEAESVTGSEDDDCCICGNGDVENVNQIIYCDMCNIAVHQDCYGVPYIPDGQWLCRKCKLSPMEPVKCELCPLRDGAFKPTSDGKWAHVVCAIWLNEVHFGNTAFLESIEGVQNSLRRRQKLRCLVCKVKMGACLQCSKGSCVKAFHVTCAMQADLQMVVDAQEDEKAPDGINVKRFVYCHVHGSIAQGENEFAKNKKKAIEAIRRARRKMATSACSSNSAAAIPHVDPEAKKRIEEQVGEPIDDIMGFWFFKRKRRCGLPLIRRLQVKKKVVPRVPTANGEASRRGRIMFERARLLIELMIKREKNYAEAITTERQILPALLNPLDDILVDFVKSLYAYDTHKFFHHDPLKQGLLHYATIVKKPMDLDRMRANANSGVYKTEADLKRHLDLIFRNCELFNESNEGVKIYSRAVQAEMNRAYADLVEYLKFTQRWLEEMNLEEEAVEKIAKKEVKEEAVEKIVKKEVKEEKKEVKKEAKEAATPRDAPTPREETNKRKRKLVEEPKREVETPVPKREKRGREKEKETPKPAVTTPIFGSTIATPSSTICNPSFSSLRRSSLDVSRNANTQKNTRSVRLTRGSTQSNFNAYRDISSVLSPDMGVTSCDSAVESDVEPSRPVFRPYSSLSDRNSLQHGDLVKVDVDSRKWAGTIVHLAEALLEDPRNGKLLSSMKSDANHVIVKTFGNNVMRRYDSSCVVPLNIDSDHCEGIDEAKKHWKSIICSK